MVVFMKDEKFRVVFLRTNRIDPDPRVEKEINSLLSTDKIVVDAVVWDRTEKYNKKEKIINYSNGKFEVIQFGIPATWGGGMKANFFPMLKFERKLFFWLLNNYKKYDCVHACDLLTGLPAILPCKIHHKKLVYDIFDYYAATQHGPRWILNFISKIENFVINRSNYTIICSEKRKEQIAGATPKKLIVLHNSPSQSQISASLCSKLICKGNARKIKIVYVGNLVEDRQIMKAIDCIDDLDNVEFHIGGYGVLADDIYKISQRDDKVFFYGKLQYADVLALERQCDIMLALYDPAIPNHAYAAPNKFYEALALGKPIIMFANTGMDIVVRENQIGAVCDPTNDGIVCAIQSLISQKESWNSISKKMKKMFKNEYSWDIMEKRLIDLYTDLALK